MSFFTDLAERARGLFLRRREDDQLDQELQFHLEMEARRLERSGASPEEARRLSRAKLGGVERTKEDVRDARGTRWLDDLVADAAFALRTLRRAPGFAVTLIIMLAIGIGSNTTIFTLINAVTVRGLPVERPSELVAIGDPAMAMSSGFGLRVDVPSYPLYRDIREHGGPFTGILAAGPADRVDIRIDGSGELEHPAGRFVSDNYFTVLGVRAMRGRVFGDAEQAVDASPSVVISHAYWTRRFNADSSVVGRSIVVGDARMTIVGVTVPGFTGEVVGAPTDVWMPISMHDMVRPNRARLENRRSIWLLLLGRLKPGATVEQARADLAPFIVRTVLANAAGDGVANFHPKAEDVVIGSGHRGFTTVDGLAAPLYTLMAGVALLLCIVCANVANLILARTVTRAREMTVRVALGAGRTRLVRLLLTESVILALVGMAAGIGLATVASKALIVAAGAGSPVQLDLSMDLRVLALTLAATFATVVFFGLIPALRASKAADADALRAGARAVSGAFGGRRLSLGAALIAGQVALSLALLVGAGMLTRSLRNLQGAGTGLDRDRLLIVDVDIATPGYRFETLSSLTQTLRERLSAIPGVSDVSYSENGIFSGSEWSTNVTIPGVERAPDLRRAGVDNVGPGYVRAIGARVIAGREFVAGDVRTPVRMAMVNRAFAAYFYQRENVVGEIFRIEDSIPIAIVGVVDDIRDHSLSGAVRRRMYFPYTPADTQVSNPSSLRFAVRTDGDPGALTVPVRKALAAVDPLLPIAAVEPLASLMRQSIREERLLAGVASAFGLVALALASIGLYGIMTYAVRRRTRELGLRSALGARSADVLSLVFKDAVRVVAIGAAAGVPLAVVAAQLLSAQLHGVPPIDGASFGVALTVLAVSAACAAIMPAAVASRVSPLVALRAE